MTELEKTAFYRTTGVRMGYTHKHLLCIAQNAATTRNGKYLVVCKNIEASLSVLWDCFEAPVRIGNVIKLYNGSAIHFVHPDTNPEKLRGLQFKDSIIQC